MAGSARHSRYWRLALGCKSATAHIGVDQRRRVAPVYLRALLCGTFGDCRVALIKPCLDGHRKLLICAPNGIPRRESHSGVADRVLVWTRDSEPEVLPSCRRLGVAIVAYCPLGRGFERGAFKSPNDLDADDYRRFNPRFEGENFVRNLKLVGHVKRLTSEVGMSAGQLALAWVLTQGEDVVPIPGTKRRKCLDENAASAEISLAHSLLQELNEVFPPDAAAGDPYVPSMKELVNG